MSHNQIQELLSHVEDVDLWLKYLPPSDYEFQGIFCTLLTDTTSTETLSRLKEKLLQKNALISDEKINQLEINLCTFFNETDLKMGVCSIEHSKISHLDKDLGIRHGLISDKFPKLISSKTVGSIYEKVVKSKSFVVIEHLDLYKHPSLVELELLKKGFKSILVAPLLNKNNSVIGILELASTIPFRLNSLSVLKLKNIISLFNVAMERSQIEVRNQIEAIIRKNFTSIHPSIEWAFVDAATQQLAKNSGTYLLDEDQFVFRNTYPLYGQADIVGSTVTRNNAIQTDLIDNLYHIKKLLTLSNKYYAFPLADQIILEVDLYIGQLKRGINSNSEYMVMEFIRNEVHPLIKHLKKKSTVAKLAYYRYVKMLDPQLQTIYRKRKDYESSVSMINRTLSTFLEKEQDKAQEMCPHYFEKFQTDGVSYNIYVGQSLLRKGKLSSFHLRNIRLWQLISMCQMTRKIVDIQTELPIPLATAQLILVHSNPISIRFRMDEKRFDVDGAYNARYEIIKKRIDKALVEGTNERLTIAGKIAIVYQQEKDKKEYLRYLNYLIKKGFIERNIEDLALRKLQGVQGLKALRVTVKV